MSIVAHTVRSRSLSAALLLAGAAFTPACVGIGPGVRGSGVPATEARTTPAFERVAIRGHANVEVEVRAGAAALVEVTLDDNLIGSFESHVEGDVLELGFASGSWSPRVGPEVRIVTADLAGIAIHGSGTVVARGVDAQQLAIAIHGSAYVRAAGRAERVEVRVYGSGDVELDELEARTADIAIHGSGDVRVRAVEALDSLILGSGDVVYSGAPRVASTIRGSGSLRQR